MRQRKHLTLAVFATAFAALLLVVAYSTGIGLNGFSTEVAEAQIKPAPRIAVDDKGEIHADDCIVEEGSRSVHSPFKECVYGKRRSNEHVVLLGDSHALQYGPTMIRLAEENGWRLTALIRQGCAIAHVNLNKICNQWRANTMRRIVRRERPDLIVVSTATTGRYKVKVKGRRLNRDQSQSHLVEGMKKTLQRLRNTGARVFVIRDQHLAPQKPPPCVRKNYKQANKACGWRPDNRRDRQGFDYDAARQVKKVKVFDPVEKYCPKGWCPVVKGGILLYRDRYHLTATYARHIAPWLGRNLPPVEKWNNNDSGSDSTVDGGVRPDR